MDRATRVAFGYHQFLTAPLFPPSSPLHIWLELGFILIFATMIAYFLSVKALHYITPFVESAYRYVLPITGAIVTIAMGLQGFSWHDPVALILIIPGFLLINKKGSGGQKSIDHFTQRFPGSPKQKIHPYFFSPSLHSKKSLSLHRIGHAILHLYPDKPDMISGWLYLG